MDMLKDILALTEIKIQILLDKETTINDMLCLQIHLQQNLNIYIYTGIIINFSLYGQICEPSKCQEALVKMPQLGCVFVSVAVHVLNMNLKSCS